MDDKNSPKSNRQKFKKINISRLLLFAVPVPIVLTIGFFLKSTLFQEVKNSGIAAENASSESTSSTQFRAAVNQATQAATLTQSAKSKQQWQVVAETWQKAIALMKSVPASTPQYQVAQQKVTEYQRNLQYSQQNAGNSVAFVPSPPKTSAPETQPLSTQFREAVNQAMQAANLTQSAKSKQQWQIVTERWQKAIALMKSVPNSAPQYQVAQQKVAEYQRNFQYSQQNAGDSVAFVPSPPKTTAPETQPSSTQFREAVNQAMQAATLTQSAKSKQQWQIVTERWQKAIALMKSVPNSAPQYQVAQQKITEYQSYLNYALANSENSTSSLQLKKIIQGSITPKSVVYSGSGLFFAQNMMYSHTITVYDRDYKLLKTIPDAIDLSKYGYKQFKGVYRGAPVEAAFSHNGKYAWISNYQMYGTGFNRPGDDKCSPGGKHDPSFLYRLNTENLQIDDVIQVGAVPKFVATSPDNRLVLVTNWCSWDLSIIDTKNSTEIRRIKLGAYPRGTVVDATSKTAYIAVMGSSDIAKVNLENFALSWIKGVGAAPRHLNIDPEGKYLYVTLNNEGRVAKIDLATEKVVKKVATGTAPRSMAISKDGQFIYVVNYNSNTFSKVRTSDMKVMQTVNVNSHPIGITYDPDTKQIWVACYSGSILVFQE